MDSTIFEATDAAIKEAKGSRDPKVVADFNRIMIGEPLSGSIVGMAMRFSYLGAVAINGHLDEAWSKFTL